MKNRISLFLGLLVAVELRPTGLELVAGALAYKALTSKTVKTFGAVFAGYFLNTVAGKQLAARIKDLAIKRIFTSYTNNFELSNPVQHSCSDLISGFFKSTNIDVFCKGSSSLTSIKENIGLMNPFKIRDSKINIFYSSEDSVGSQAFHTTGSQSFSTTDSWLRGTDKSAASGFVHDVKVTNIIAQQARGFGSKIENNFNFGGYWKGFAHGSFGAWLTAWFLTSDTKNKKEKEGLVLSDLALGKESFLDNQQESLLKQDLAS